MVSNLLMLISCPVLDLKAYVKTGRLFPTTDAKFDAQITKDAFRRLDQVDDKIYEVCVALYIFASSISLTTTFRSSKPRQALLLSVRPATASTTSI